MSRKALSMTCAGFFFLGAFFYLHQKVQIYVEAYRLSRNYQLYNECIDKRDYLMYNFMKEVSLTKLNAWVEKNNFSPIEKQKVLAFNLEKKKVPASKNKFASLLNKAIGFSSSSSTVLAKERDR
ncbi:MAG: hypothetical protein PHQ96_01600 [Candidatus Omnitrophica bacterium]|nr:hypothetical protein [Candidatus Omnitrophota bacterium]